MLFALIHRIGAQTIEQTIRIKHKQENQYSLHDGPLRLYPLPFFPTHRPATACIFTAFTNCVTQHVRTHNLWVGGLKS